MEVNTEDIIDSYTEALKNDDSKHQLLILKTIIAEIQRREKEIDELKKCLEIIIA